MADGGTKRRGEKGVGGGRGQDGEDGVDLLEEGAGLGRSGLLLIRVPVAMVGSFLFAFILVIGTLLLALLSLVAIIATAPVARIQQPIRLVQYDQPHAVQLHPPLKALD